MNASTERLQGWLDQIAEQDGPGAAFRRVVDLLEYRVPKLARTELTGKDDAPVQTIVKHIYEDGS